MSFEVAYPNWAFIIVPVKSRIASVKVIVQKTCRIVIPKIKTKRTQSHARKFFNIFSMLIPPKTRYIL